MFFWCWCSFHWHQHRHIVARADFPHRPHTPLYQQWETITRLLNNCNWTITFANFINILQKKCKINIQSESVRQSFVLIRLALKLWIKFAKQPFGNGAPSTIKLNPLISEDLENFLFLDCDPIVMAGVRMSFISGSTDYLEFSPCNCFLKKFFHLILKFIFWHTMSKLQVLMVSCSKTKQYKGPKSNPVKSRSFKLVCCYL